LAGHLVVDWDFLMEPAGQLIGRSIRTDRSAWPFYDALVRAVLEQVNDVPVVLLGVRTPDELQGWPIGAWILLDCSDDVRVTRLGERLGASDIAEAIEDGQSYRKLGLPVIDSTSRTIDEVAEDLTSLIVHLDGHG
jgi:hypothetical protein